MKERSRHCVLVLACLALTACAAPRPAPRAPVASTDSDEALMAAIDDYVQARHAPRNTHYLFTRVDLDGDGRRDGIVLMDTPYLSWCNKDGCHMIIFRAADGGGFALAGDIAPVRGPLVVSDRRTNGWRDIILHVDGHMETPAQDVALRYDGQSYVRAGAVTGEQVGGIKIFP